MEEHIRNLLAIARNERGCDEIIHARAVKELERWRGSEEVDDFFKLSASRLSLLALKQRILALKGSVK